MPPCEISSDHDGTMLETSPSFTVVLAIGPAVPSKEGLEYLNDTLGIEPYSPPNKVYLKLVELILVFFVAITYRPLTILE